MTSPTLAQEPGTIVEFNDSVRDFIATDHGYTEVNLRDYFGRVNPDVARWYQHVNTLANPWMEGRQPGTPGDDLSTEYIEFHLNKSGLQPAFVTSTGEKSWRQPFTFQMGRRTPTLESSTVSIMDAPLVRGEDYTVLANSGSGEITAPVTFVGYAIEEGVDGYDSFGDDDDLSGRIAIMLRYEPIDGAGVSRWADEGWSSHAGIAPKFEAVLDRDVAGVILVTSPKAIDARSGLESLRGSRGWQPRAEVPVVHMTPDQVDTLLKRAHPDKRGLAELRRAADRDRLDTLDLSDDVTVTLQTELSASGIPARNVGGVIPGSGSLADEWLIIGGHYDHLGTGYTGSRARGSNRIHTGADDNASGTASLLVMADRLARRARNDEGDRRSVMVVGFGAEEAGLHGSAYFADNPPMDIEDVTCMLNFDMMGNLSERGLQVLGTGTAEEFEEMLPRHVAESPLVVYATPSGTGPSDHTSFYNKGIPVLFFFTGITDEYHTPEDQAWLVNPEGAVHIINLAEGLADEMVTRDELLTYQEANQSRPRGGARSRVRLGVMPAYNADVETGVMIDGVSENTSASKAGIKPGDILVGWNDQSIEDGQKLMNLLRDASPGDTVDVTILRKGKLEKLPVTLQGMGD
ncbi:MAG: M28 family peptidase [Phycisphaerales bacterium]|nr:M28 family peptidase [Phycisphaerales bacterium]